MRGQLEGDTCAAERTRLEPQRRADQHGALAHAAHAAALAARRAGSRWPSSSTSSRGRPPASSSRTSARLAPRVAGDVGQRLLGDAVEHELGVAAELRQAGLDVDVDARARSARRRARRARAARSPGRGRRAPPAAAGARSGAPPRGCRGRSPAPRGRRSRPRLGHVAGGAAELQHDAGQRLADAVVELLRDAQPLALLRGQRAADAVAALGLEPLEHLVEGGRELGRVGVAAADLEPVARARAGRSGARTRSARAAAPARGAAAAG